MRQLPADWTRCIGSTCAEREHCARYVSDPAKVDRHTPMMDISKHRANKKEVCPGYENNSRR